MATAEADRAAAVVVTPEPERWQAALDALRETTDVALVVGEPTDEAARAAAAEMAGELFRERGCALLRVDGEGRFLPID